LPSSPLNAAFTGIARNLQWRPKTVTKNPDYPRVTAPGCYWQDHSGGFHLLHRKTNKYLGHYTKDAIAKLEAKYGSKPKKTLRRKRK